MYGCIFCFVGKKVTESISDDTSIIQMGYNLRTVFGDTWEIRWGPNVLKTTKITPRSRYGLPNTASIILAKLSTNLKRTYSHFMQYKFSHHACSFIRIDFLYQFYSVQHTPRSKRCVSHWSQHHLLHPRVWSFLTEQNLILIIRNVAIIQSLFGARIELSSDKPLIQFTQYQAIR